MIGMTLDSMIVVLVLADDVNDGGGVTLMGVAPVVVVVKDGTLLLPLPLSII